MMDRRRGANALVGQTCWLAMSRCLFKSSKRKGGLARAQPLCIMQEMLITVFGLERDFLFNHLAHNTPVTIVGRGRCDTDDPVEPGPYTGLWGTSWPNARVCPFFFTRPSRCMLCSALHHAYAHAPRAWLWRCLLRRGATRTGMWACSTPRCCSSGIARTYAW